MRYWDATYTKTNQQCRAEDCLVLMWTHVANHSKYGMICHMSSLIKQPCDFERNFEVFDFALLQLAYTLNTQFKYRESSWHSLLKHLECWRKSCAKFDSLLSKTYWIFRTRLHALLKKWTLKFKLLYLLNRIRYFNRICRICEMNPHL